MSRSATSSKQHDRLPSLSYSIMAENTLRKKFALLGIPNWGPKQLLVRRHTEWVNLWNANCDSSRPRKKRDLLSDLDSWERTQGGLAPNVSSSQNGAGSVMRKDFDGEAWAANHEDDFQQLIAKARQNRNTHAVQETSKSPEQSDSCPDGNVTQALSSNERNKSKKEEIGPSMNSKNADLAAKSVQHSIINVDSDGVVK